LETKCRDISSSLKPTPFQFSSKNILIISSKRKVWNSADDNTNVAVQKKDQASSSNDDSNSKPALIMSIISIVLWGCALILFLFTKLGNKKENNILLSEESKNPEKEIA